ncbi:MAG: hypothetical protein EOO61_04505 [Hymenobacter sp.]|nr:MAG: hypothetical protein EOO61_04505 [Hymenobacter sp.]
MAMPLSKDVSNMGFIVVVLALIGFAVFAVAEAVYRGWILAILWAWFIVPLGVVPVTIPWAIGIMFVVGLITPGVDATKPERTTDETIAVVLGKLLAPLVLLGAGAIVHSFM